MKYFVIGAFIVTLFSCAAEEQKPDYLLSEDKLVDVFTDFQIAEAIVRLGYHRTKDSMFYNDSLYNAVFRKHNISEAIFDSNFTYLTDHPKELERIFENVIDTLSSKSAKLLEAKK
jgi:hypothetical protein